MPELQGTVQGPSHRVPMGTCSELEERAEQLSKPQLFLLWPADPLGITSTQRRQQQSAP